MEQLEALQNALNHFGLAEQCTIYINYEADKRKEEKNRRRYFISFNESSYSPQMTYNECNHFILGMEFMKKNNI